MRLVEPLLGNQQCHRSVSDIDGPVEDSLGPVSRDWHAYLFTDVAVGTVQRWCLRDDGLVEHQQ